MSFKTATLAALLFAAITFNVQARCVLPLPDGGRTPSPANLRGTILTIDHSLVRIQDARSHRPVSVRLPPALPIYTAFGGDDSQDKLVAGQLASVWYEHCRRGKESTPVAAYFQIYSLDPNDRPQTSKAFKK